MADAHGSGPCGGNSLQVQVLLSAPYRVFITDLSYGHSIFLCQSVSLYVWSRSLSCSFVLCRLGNILNRNPFSGIRLVIASARWNFNHSNKLVVNHDSLASVLTHAFCLVNRNLFNQFPQQRRCQRLHLHKPPHSTNELLFILLHSSDRIKPFPEFGNSAFQF